MKMLAHWLPWLTTEPGSPAVLTTFGCPGAARTLWESGGDSGRFPPEQEGKTNAGSYMSFSGIYSGLFPFPVYCSRHGARWF